MSSPETIGSVTSTVAQALTEAGFDEPRRRARRVIAAALALSPTEVFAGLDRMVTDAESERVSTLLARIVAHEPLSRILGVREFWGLEFLLSPDTLDPRPESETIVEAVLARLPDRGRAYRILDLGTGSGCLLLALLSERPMATGVGVDCTCGAANAARDNARRLGLAGRARFAVGDWAAAITGPFDAVVANPPYIASSVIATLAPEVRDFDPHIALDGGADGLAAYRAIARDLPRLLMPGGIFAGELGFGQGRAVAETIASVGLAVETIIPDLADIPRCIVARMPGGTRPIEKMVGTPWPPA
jgi:release factor glutamine methyltransferase